MRITCTHDPDAGVIRVEFELADTSPPDKAADVAWAAVEKALTDLPNPNGD